jgi:hypothetical protein
MKKILLILTAIMIGTTVIFDGQGVNDSNAAGGCCMERRDLNKGNWRKNGLDFRECRNENNQRDNDDIYRATGYIWWNEDC